MSNLFSDIIPLMLSLASLVVSLLTFYPLSAKKHKQKENKKNKNVVYYLPKKKKFKIHKKDLTESELSELDERLRFLLSAMLDKSNEVEGKDECGLPSIHCERKTPRCNGGNK